MISSRVRQFAPLISTAVVLLVLIGLMFVIKTAPFQALGEIRFGTVSWAALLFVGGMQLIFLLLSAEIWRRVVRVLTGANVGLVSSYMQLAAVAVGKYVPGKIWGFLARAVEMDRKKIPIHLVVMSSVVEQMLVLSGAILVATGAAMIAVPQYWSAILLSGILAIVGLIIVSLRIPKITNWLIRKRVPDAITGPIEGYNRLGLLKFVFGYAILWVISGAIFSAIYFSLFDVSVTSERVAALVLANTLGIVIGFFAFFAPGGIGVREAIATVALAPFVPVGEALLAAVAYRAWMVLIDGVNAVALLVREASLKGSLIANLDDQQETGLPRQGDCR